MSQMRISYGIYLLLLDLGLADMLWESQVKEMKQEMQMEYPQALAKD